MKRKIVCRLLAVSLSAVMCTAAVPPGTAYAAGAASEEEGAYDNSEQMTDENTQGLVGSKNETVQAQTSDLAGSAEESETAQTQATDSTGNSTSTDVASSQTDDMSASEDGTESAPAQNSAALVGSADTDSARALKTWDFNDGTAQGWDYNSGWNYQYDGAASTSVTNENSMLKFNVDYSANSSSTWSQPVLTVYPSGLDISGADLLTFDFYYNPALLGSGSFATKVTVQNSSWSEDTSSYGNIDLSGAVDADGMDGYKKVTVKLSIPQAVTTSECACVALGIIGNMTAYKGAVYLDNISQHFIFDRQGSRGYGRRFDCENRGRTGRRGQRDDTSDKGRFGKCRDNCAPDGCHDGRRKCDGFSEKALQLSEGGRPVGQCHFRPSE